MRCIHCGYGSLVRSNFRLSANGMPYCKSEAKPECEVARMETRMAYTDKNYKTKKAIKDDIAKGVKITCHQPNGDLTGVSAPTDGRIFLEGPHYPQPHRWYAEGEMKDGYLVRIK